MAYFTPNISPLLVAYHALAKHQQAVGYSFVNRLIKAIKISTHTGKFSKTRAEHDTFNLVGTF